MTGRATQIRRLAADWPASLLGALRHRRDFRELASYCFFVGHPRSGHSIVGGLLDAHPDVVIAHEQGSLKYIHAHFSRLQLFYLLFLLHLPHVVVGGGWKAEVQIPKTLLTALLTSSRTANEEKEKKVR